MKTAEESAAEIARLWAETAQGEDDLRSMLLALVADARRAALKDAEEAVAKIMRYTHAGSATGALLAAEEAIRALLDSAPSCYCDGPEIQVTCPVHGMDAP
jgi:hypothetical protein